MTPRIRRAPWLAPALLAWACAARAEEPRAPQLVVVEAETPAAREPDDGSFARAVDSRWASGRQCLVSFHGAGRVSYDVQLPRSARWSAWLRYSSTADVRIGVALDGEPARDFPAPATGALAGKRAWGWTRVFAGELAAGPHALALTAAPLRPDCIAFTTDAAEPDYLRPRAPDPHDEDARARMARALGPARPDWLDEVAGHALPDWFEGARVSLHTRLSPRWRERPAFRAAAEHFHALGAETFVRHVKTAGEGAWWPSAVGAVEPWAVEEDGARALVERAHDAGCRLIAYYRHIEDTALAAEHPDWVARDDLGRPYDGRNGAPALCFNSPYADFVEARLLELVERGVDGIYFDEFHVPPTGCWCDFCRARFRALTGLEHPDSIDGEDPLWRALVDFGNRTIERTFRRYRRALHAANPAVVLVVGTYRSADFFDRHVTGRLLRLADSPKTEFPKGASNRADAFLRRHPEFWTPPRDARLALGWTWNRDGAEGRPPHVWVHALLDEPSATFATAGLLAYGCVANLDHPEDEIGVEGGGERFRNALRLGRSVAPTLAGMRPVCHVVLHVPELARAARAPDEVLLWTDVLAPLYAAWTALVRARVPVGIVTDNQLAEGLGPDVAALVLPAPGDLTAEMARAAAELTERGGRVVRLDPALAWEGTAERERAVRALLDELGPALAATPVRVLGGPERMHALAYRDRADTRLVVCLANDFGWVWAGRRELPGGRPLRLPAECDRVPADCAGATVELRTSRAPARCTELVTDRALAWERDGPLVRVAVPAFRALAAVRIDF